MKEPIKIVVLPTEDTNPTLRKGPDGKLRVNYTSTPSPNQLPQYTYITVSQDIEPTKSGDWMYDSEENDIIQRSDVKDTNKYIKKFCRKVIATDDPRLKLKHYTRFNSCCRYESECHCNIPQVQQSFIKEFVANPGGEYEVEYHFTGRCEDPMVCLRGCSIRDATCRHHLDKGTKLSINKDNEVNITSVVEKMYTRKEVYNLMFQAWIYGESDKSMDYRVREKWIEKNL
jgi:hypothetical protein